MKARTLLRTRKVEILGTIALFVAFFLLYLWIAQAYREVPGYSEYRNTFFGADHNEAVQGWIEGHKGIHPLVLLLVVPLGRVLLRLLGSYELGLVVAAATYGGLAVTLVFWVVRALIERTYLAVVITCFYGLSMSQLVFACLPDTYEISVVSLVPTYLLTLWSLRQGRFDLGPFILAGILSFAITITNVVQTLLCLLVVVCATRPKGERLAPVWRFVVAVGAAAVVLSLLQGVLFPGAMPFFVPQVYGHELHYVAPLLVENPLVVLQETGRSFLLYNFVGQFPRVALHEPGRRVELVYYGEILRYGWLAAAAALLWIGLLLRGLWLGGGSDTTRLFRIAVLSVVLFNVAMHAVYGTKEIFLYSPHFTFAVLWLALDARAAAGRMPALAWSLLALLAGVNNLLVVRQIVATFAS